MADQNIAELPVKTASDVGGADHLLVIDAADGYLITAPNLAKYVFDNYLSSYIQSGKMTSSVTIASGAYEDLSFLFTKSFSSIPKVVMTLGGAGNNAYRGQVSVMIKSVDTNGFSVRIYNASAAVITFSSGYWIAMI